MTDTRSQKADYRAERQAQATAHEDKPWNRVEAPTVTKDGQFGDKHEHPAFATISAARVSGGSPNLFGSNVGHTGFVKIEVHEARLYRDGYSERIHGGGRTYIEVNLSEAQWVAFVSRMNVGSGTPCTLRHYGNRDGTVFCPHIADAEKAAERMEGRISEMHGKKLEDISKTSGEIRALCEGLPVRKRDAILHALGMLTQHLKANHAYAAETLRDYKEKLVVESKTEIDAMLTDAVARFGLASIQQLGQVLATDPEALQRVIEHTPAYRNGETVEWYDGQARAWRPVKVVDAAPGEVVVRIDATTTAHVTGEHIATALRRVEDDRA